MRKIALGLGVSAVTMVCLGGMASAEGLSRSDKLGVLYSSQFAFDRRGVPLITIGIVQGRDEVVVEGDAGMRVLPEGEDGSEVLGGTRWKVALGRSKAATIEHFVVLVRAPTSRMDLLRRATDAWSKRGIKPRIIEVGTIFGIKGRVFDNRAMLLADGPYADHRSARAKAERYLAKGWVDKVATTAQLEKRPSAELIATDLASGLRIRLRDAIWFAPPKAGRKLRVVLGGKRARPYWGRLTVTVDRQGKLAVVNAVAADKLLAGLVPAEIFPSAPSAALQAQSVAARSDLLAKLGTRHFVDPYLICAWQHCQMYRGAGHEHPRTTDAVHATRGLVLAHPHGGLVDAVYHANSGGHTENNENVWPGAPDAALRGKLDGEGRMMASFRGGIGEHNIHRWLTTRPDSWSARSGVNRDKLRWKAQRSAATLSLKLRHLGVGRVHAIKVLSRGRSGRAHLVELVGSRGKGRIRGELNIRRALGNLRSSMFVVKALKDARGQVTAFDFLGGGWGHGVGMCQSGAIGMAKAGKSFRQILGHYYTGGTVRPVY